MVEEKALTTMSAEDLKTLSAMARSEDTGTDMGKIPVLKINYDPEAKIDRGEWVVGQEKDSDGIITDQGRRVNGMVILTMRRRYSLFVMKDKEQNCSSPMFIDSQTVFGSKYGYNCKSGECPKRAKDADPRCKAQWVVFSLALTEDKKLVECISYIQGTGFMPFEEYRRSLNSLAASSGVGDIPPFAFATMLGSTKKRNAGTTYFEPTFKRGKLFSLAQVKKFAEKRDGAYQVIEALNSKVQKINDSPVTGTAIAVPPASKPVEKPHAESIKKTAATVEPSKEEDPFDGVFEVEAKSVSTATIPVEPTTVAESVAPADTPIAEPYGVDASFDLEATIKSALGG